MSCGATMACGTEARTSVVAGADLRLAEAAVPDRPRHADISRSDLSQSLHSDTRRAEEGAGGAVAYGAADAPRQRRQGQEWTGTNPRWSRSASGQPRPRIALCRATGKETFLPERTIRTSPHSSSATAALRCSSRFQEGTRRPL